MARDLPTTRNRRELIGNVEDLNPRQAAKSIKDGWRQGFLDGDDEKGIAQQIWDVHAERVKNRSIPSEEKWGGEEMRNLVEDFRGILRRKGLIGGP